MEDDTSLTVDMGSGLHTFRVCNRMHGPLMAGRQCSDWLVVSGAVNFGLAGLWTFGASKFRSCRCCLPCQGIILSVGVGVKPESPSPRIPSACLIWHPP
ncbi:hypothetical protein QC761_0046490 [Podospora bellae-mahoneyi]|uniref:Uncharacterized protein n=1 Tax=Podospora bellae-mahoneyi TaxID=2093777 RepID=A0ABR0FS61_9PEZI|nr:hypothetical protein QC761_0046490 [Podospora bellae-mahoneyi]